MGVFNSPGEHPYISEREKKYIQQSIVQAGQKRGSKEEVGAVNTIFIRVLVAPKNRTHLSVSWHQDPTETVTARFIPCLMFEGQRKCVLDTVEYGNIMHSTAHFFAE